MYRLVVSLFLLCFFPISIFAYINAGEFMYTPSAIMPKAGNIEYGFRAASYI